MTDTENFQFKKFQIEQDQCAMKIGTDGILLGAWTATNEVNSALDIGCGTGLIALMIAQRTSNASIDAVEIDEASALQATQNVANSPWFERINVFNKAIQDFSSENRRKYDLIVSNPPFFTGGTFSDNQDKNSVRHTIKLPHNDLLRSVQNLLAPNGRFAAILPYIEGLRFCELAQTYQLHCVRKTEVIPQQGKNVERLLLEFTKEKSIGKDDQLMLRSASGNEFTSEYVNLTRDFYLDLEKSIEIK